MLIRILREELVRPHRRLLLAIAALQCVQVLASLYLPTLNGEIIDRGVARGDRHVIWTLGATMLVTAAVQVIGSVGATYLATRVAAQVGRNLRARVFRTIGTFSGQEVERFGTPSLITRCTNDVQQVQMLGLMLMNVAITTPLMVVGGVVMALRQDAGMWWLMAVSVPALVGSIGTIVVKMVPRFRLLQRRIDRVNQVLREQLSGIRVVRAFVREQHEEDRFAEVNDDVTRVGIGVGNLMTMIFPTVLLVFNASSVAVMWFGAHRVAQGHLEIGGLIAFLAYLVQILMSVMMVTFVATAAPRAAVCGDRIGEVLGTSTSVLPPARPVRALEHEPVLSFEHVGFTYPGADAPVLDDVTFAVAPGTTTAIIGSTGSGKSTLASLVPRLFDATSGTVRIGGVDVRDIAPDLLANIVSMVPQRPYLFSGSVASNLRYGDPAATDEDLWSALRVAQAEEFVRALPDGLAAPIAQGGTNVSGGQRQRLAIARALVARPRVLLFDDSSSALDLRTDARLRSALRTAAQDVAVVVIAQRVATILHADQIVVLENGEVVGIGTHQHLVSTCPTYQEIVESQLDPEEAA